MEGPKTLTWERRNRGMDPKDFKDYDDGEGGYMENIMAASRHD